VTTSGSSDTLDDARLIDIEENDCANELVGLEGLVGCYKGVTRVLQGCCKGVTRV
jgi:hypothetical protein